MWGVWTADQIRDAEASMMRRVPGETIMRRAAYGLAVRVRVELGPAVTGRHVVLLVGAGHNGGDALWA
ncbi:NAD(P)H-hydrate epimerase, partial [Pseudonocardia abyssalis]